MATKLRTDVHVYDPDQPGVRQRVPAGTPASDTLRKLVPNPKAWVDEPDQPDEQEPVLQASSPSQTEGGDGQGEGGPAPQDSGDQPPQRKADEQADETDERDDGGDIGGDDESPQAGTVDNRAIAAPNRNASRAAWASFAEELGVEVPENTSRDSIIDLLDARGLVE